MKPKRETEQVGEVLPVADTEIDAHRRLLRELCSHGNEQEFSFWDSASQRKGFRGCAAASLYPKSPNLSLSIWDFGCG